MVQSHDKYPFFKKKNPGIMLQNWFSIYQNIALKFTSVIAIPFSHKYISCKIHCPVLPACFKGENTKSYFLSEQDSVLIFMRNCE